MDRVHSVCRCARCLEIQALLEVGRVFHSGRTSVQVTAVEPDIRCHLVTIHLYFEFYCHFFILM